MTAVDPETAAARRFELFMAELRALRAELGELRSVTEDNAAASDELREAVREVRAALKGGLGKATTASLIGSLLGLRKG